MNLAALVVGVLPPLIVAAAVGLGAWLKNWPRRRWSRQAPQSAAIGHYPASASWAGLLRRWFKRE